MSIEKEIQLQSKINELLIDNTKLVTINGKLQTKITFILNKVMPIVIEIDETNKFFRFVKVVKLAVTLVDLLIKEFKNEK